MPIYSNIVFFNNPSVQTPAEYYDDVDNLGSYQWITLKQIMDDMMLSIQDDDHLLKNTKRSLILLHAKNAIKKHRKLSNDIISIEMTVGDSLRLPLPQDFVDYQWISVVGSDFRLYPLNINNNINIATGILQDNDANILFDQNEQIVTADSSNAYAKPFNKYEFFNDFQGGFFETDTSVLSKYGEAIIDERRGYILFSSDLRDREIVLKYYSDGLQWQNIQETEITVHKKLEFVIKDWIFYACIQHKRNVSRGEKLDALNRYKTTLHEAKIDQLNFSLIEVSRAMGTASQML